MHWVSTICVTYSRFKDAQRKTKQFLYPTSQRTGPYRSFLQPSDYPQLGQVGDECCLTSTQGRKPRASSTEVKQETVQQHRRVSLLQIFLSKYYYMCMHTKSFQSWPTLRNPMDCSPPGSSVHGLLQARVLEWVAMYFSRGSSRPRNQTHVSCLLHWQVGSLPLAPPGKPVYLRHKGKTKMTVTENVFAY